MGKRGFIIYTNLALIAFIAQQLPAPRDLGFAVQVRDAAAGMNAWKSTVQKLVTPVAATAEIAHFKRDISHSWCLDN